MNTFIKLSKNLGSGYVLFLLFTLASCNLSDITNSAKTIDGEMIPPDRIESPEGARWVYLGAVGKFNQYLGLQATSVAIFTDELALLPDLEQISIDVRANLDVVNRPGPYVISSTTSSSQATRVQLEQAIQLLDKYSGVSGNPMKAHAYALLSLTYTMIADVTCSGYAISESKWGGEFIPGRALSTDSLYARAIAIAEKGLAIETDSLPLTLLLKGVKARALNSQGRYKDASDMVSDVPDIFAISEVFLASKTGVDTSLKYFPQISLEPARYTILNNKGGNGLDWVAALGSQQDMRVPVRADGQGNFIYPLNTDFSFSSRSVSYFSGVEARLIEAEYYLDAGQVPQFIERINSVRRLYKLRSGAQLADTTDPGSPSGRIDLLFRERAYTFYATGRRLGDLRKLTRRYGRDPENVWPIGPSEGKLILTYGNNYVFVPEVQGLGEEATNNPNYEACESYEP